MLITTDPSRIPDIIPLVRPGDRVLANLPEFKVPAYLDVRTVSAEGVQGIINLEENTLVRRLYAWQLRGKESKVYFAPWDKVERIYMRE